MADLREQILALRETGSTLVDLPELGEGRQIEVRGLTAGERAKFLNAAVRSNGTTDFEKAFPLLVILSSHDPGTGDRLFEDADRDSITALPGGLVERIAEAAIDLSGLSEAAQRQAKSDPEE